MDKTTLTAARGKFARVCVEVHISKPLRSGYTLRGKHWPVQYEGLHTLCFNCGWLGHLSNTCPALLSTSSAQTSADDSSSLNVQPPSWEADAMDRLNGVGDTAGYGEWMAVTKPRRLLVH